MVLPRDIDQPFLVILAELLEKGLPLPRNDLLSFSHFGTVWGLHQIDSILVNGQVFSLVGNHNVVKANGRLGLSLAPIIVFCKHDVFLWACSEMEGKHDQHRGGGWAARLTECGSMIGSSLSAWSCSPLASPFR